MSVINLQWTQNSYGPDYIYVGLSDDISRDQTIFSHCCGIHDEDTITNRIFKEVVGPLLTLHGVKFNLPEKK